jgi:hypothetical protein
MADKVRLTVNFRDSNEVVWPSGFYAADALPDTEEIKPYITSISELLTEVAAIQEAEEAMIIPTVEPVTEATYIEPTVEVVGVPKSKSPRNVDINKL